MVFFGDGLILVVIYYVISMVALYAKNNKEMEAQCSLSIFHTPPPLLLIVITGGACLTQTLKICENLSRLSDIWLIQTDLSRAKK